MSINRITSSQFSSVITNGVNERDETMDTAIGSIKDFFIDPFAEVLEQQNDRVVYISNLNSLKYVNKAIPDDLNDIIYNEAMIRWNGSRAVTVLTFARTQPPSSDIVIPINFPIATVVDAATGRSIVFKTVETKTMYSAAPSSYYNADNEKYEIDIAVASIIVGETSKVGAYTIKNMRRPLTGIDEVYNKSATTSGRGVETNRETADRYLLHVEGSQIGTPNGTKRFILDNFSNITDAYIVYGESNYLTRDQGDTGAVDIWVLTEEPLTRTYTTNYPGIETLIPLDKQPLIEIISVSDSAVTYVEGTDFLAITGETEYAYSNLGQDGIKFIAGGTVPTVGVPLTITYKYNSMIDVLAAFFTQNDYYHMGTNRLFRWAQKKSIEIEANLKVRSGNPDSVLNAVRTAVTSYTNNLKLGEDVEEFDIDAVVAKVYGVDNWTYTTLAIEGETGVSDISIPPNEYARIPAANFVINLVS